MNKVVMFGAGNIGRNYFYNSNRRSEIVAVLDNNEELTGKLFEGVVPIIGIEEYVNKYTHNRYYISYLFKNGSCIFYF